RPRLDAPACHGSGSRPRVRADLRRHRLALGGLPPVRGPGGPGDRVPALALPPHAHGDAHHRLQARDRRLQRRGLPQAGAGPDLLPRAVRGAHADRRGPGQRVLGATMGVGSALPPWATIAAWVLALAVLACAMRGPDLARYRGAEGA